MCPARILSGDRHSGKPWIGAFIVRSEGDLTSPSLPTMKAPIQDFRFCRGWNKRTTPVNENLESVVRHFFGTGVPLRCTSTRPVIGSDISHRGCRLHIYVSEKSPGASEMERRELSSGTRLRWTVSGHLGASVYRLVLYLPTTTLFL